MREYSRNFRGRRVLFRRRRDLADSGQDWLIWYDSIYRYARALSHDPTAAEELVQETYKRALAARRKPPPEGGDQVRRWLFTIARHLWQNEMRQRRHDLRKDAGYEQAAQPSVETPESILARKLLQSEIQHALDCLPEDFREVLILREIENLSYAGIAEILQCPTGTVMSRLARARAWLRRRLVGLPEASQEWRPR